MLITYGTEVVIPVDICMPTLCTTKIDLDQNAIQLGLALDQWKEKWWEVQIRIAVYQQQIKASHHKKVPWEFQVGDLVLKRVIQSTKERNSGKLGQNWEGLYFIMARGGNGSYALADQDGRTLGKQWNFFHLKRYYTWSTLSDQWKFILPSKSPEPFK